MRCSSVLWSVRALALVVTFGSVQKSLGDDSFDDPEESVVALENIWLPKRMAVALGFGLRPRLLFGQESFYQENWSFSSAAHWKCPVLEECELLARAWYQHSLQMPEDNAVPVLNRTERELGLELGLESRALFLSGVSMGLASVERKYALDLGESVVNKSGASMFREVKRWPSARVWTGVPLWAERFDLLLSINRIFSDESESEKQTYASELRLSF